MRRFVGGALGLVVVGLLVLFGRSGQAPTAEQALAATPAMESPAGPGAALSPAPDGFADSVVVEHELIEVRPRAVRQPAPPRPRPAAVARTTDVALRGERTSLVDRTRRAIVGDGRYRPEPFPRPSTQ